MEQRAVVRRLERKWLKHGLNSIWTAYKVERNRLNRLICYHKKQQFYHQFNLAKGNSADLHKTLNKLTGKSEGNPLPDHTSSEVLANDFADFFLGKITKIRKELDKCDKYSPMEKSVPKLRRFALMTETMYIRSSCL